MQKVKKLSRFLFSMKFALILLGLLIIACVAGSVISQGEIESYYTSNYNEKLGMLILLLDLDDVFHSWWFVGLTAFLCLNLLGCNLVRFPVLIRQMKLFTPDHFEKTWDQENDGTITASEEEVAGIFKDMSLAKTAEGTTEAGQKYRYGTRNRIGIWGAWLTHLGMLIIIIGFALGQIYTVKYTVYGVPGQTKQIGDTNYSLTIDDFEISLRDDDTVEQYTASLTMTDMTTGESKSGQASVNAPLSLFGMKLYQNSTGWAAQVTVVENEEEIIQQGTLCAGEYMQVGDVDGLYVMFNAFYPDYYLDADGNPATASSELNNPGYLYSVYYDDSVIGMNVLTGTEMITIDDYAVIFRDPQMYTLIQIKHDPFTWIALIGGLIIMLALLISFFVRTEELWAIQQEDGSWAFAARSKKGGLLYKEKLQTCLKKVSNTEPEQV